MGLERRSRDLAGLPVSAPFDGAEAIAAGLVRLDRAEGVFAVVAGC